MIRPFFANLGSLVSCLLLAAAATSDAQVVDNYARNSKFSPLQNINTENVSELTLAWEYHTGEPFTEGATNTFVSLQDQPQLLHDRLIVCSAARKIAALNPATGEEIWSFNPEDTGVRIKKCRGVSHWQDDQLAEGEFCQSRIIFGTADYRLFAIDSHTGKPCDSFGEGGQVKMPTSMPVNFPAEVAAHSSPAIVNDVIVVGSAVADNQRVDAPSGRVLAFSARTGNYLWEFDPLPRDADDPALATWDKGSAEGFGGGNVWAAMAVDNNLDLVYLPTTSATSDFYGGDRPGDNLYTTSVVALKGSTGEVVWHQQLVHHNVFDYDLPTQPLLIDYPNAQGEPVPALLQNTKMGLIFIFDRQTGEPLVPIEERPVPTEGAVAGETLSPTQPFPVGMPTLAPQSFSPEDAWGFTFIDKWLCKRKIKKLKYGPIYTPPSEQGTIFTPSMGGGPNWGGGAFNPNTNVMVVPTNRVPTVAKLVPRDQAEFAVEQAVETVGDMSFDVQGAYYLPTIGPLMSPLGAPCSEPPWAALTAVDIVNKTILWEVPLGDIGAMLPFPMSWELGLPGAGGALVTGGGLVFIGYSVDNYFRAFSAATGETLWKTELPAAGTSVPITYSVDGEQFIVIPAGGHSMYGSTMGDSFIAYKLAP